MDNPKEYILGSAALAVIPVKDRSRIRMHLGSHLEIQYTLSTYGISSKQLPLYCKTNQFRFDDHLRWYNECLVRDTGKRLKNKDLVQPKSTESCGNHLACSSTQITNDSILDKVFGTFNASTTHNGVIARPGPNNVVLGRNNKGNGNQLMMCLIKDFADEYNTAGRGEKSPIADSIVHRIKQQGGKFLQQRADGMWEEVSNDFVRSKVLKLFPKS